MRRHLVAVAASAALACGALAAGCGGRAGPAGGEEDGGAADAPVVGDARLPADGILTGRPCDLDGGCAAGYTCWLMPPGGYCLVGPPTACWDSSECPTGTACSPLPMSEISGVCLRTCQSQADCRQGYACDYVYLFPGEPGSPRSEVPVCWTAPVCTYGMDQTCNDNPLISSLHGYCQPDGTCICKDGYEKNPSTGMCR
jgi:hypothetical protein